MRTARDSQRLLRLVPDTMSTTVAAELGGPWHHASGVRIVTLSSMILFKHCILQRFRIISKGQRCHGQNWSRAMLTGRARPGARPRDRAGPGQRQPTLRAHHHTARRSPRAAVRPRNRTDGSLMLSSYNNSNVLISDHSTLAVLSTYSQGLDTAHPKIAGGDLLSQGQPQRGVGATACALECRRREAVGRDSS